MKQSLDALISMVITLVIEIFEEFDDTLGLIC